MDGRVDRRDASVHAVVDHAGEPPIGYVRTSMNATLDATPIRVGVRVWRVPLWVRHPEGHDHVDVRITSNAEHREEDLSRFGGRIRPW